MSEEVKATLAIIFGIVGACAIFILTYGFVEYVMKPKPTVVEYNDKCLFEVEGNENRQFPYYELHPMEDCKE